MIFDTPNILFRVHAAQSYKTSPEDNTPGLAMHVSLNTLKSYFKKFKPDELAVVFEGSNNWRKTYTASNECVSKRGYKANRVKDDSFIPFFELIRSFEELVRNHTSLVCLSHPLLEGDDLIGGYARRFSDLGDTVIIVSGDKDFKQLLKLPNVILINPDDGKPRECDDPEFFMFEKCFRGDGGDNVMSAYPRVRLTRLQKAYTNDYELTKLLNESWSITDPETEETRTFSVQDMFVENDLLMNLEGQPDYVKQAIQETLDHELEHHGKFNYFKFVQFLGKYELESIAKQAQSFTEIFSVTGNQNRSGSREYEKSERPSALLEF